MGGDGGAVSLQGGARVYIERSFLTNNGADVNGAAVDATGRASLVSEDDDGMVMVMMLMVMIMKR